MHNNRSKQAYVGYIDKTQCTSQTMVE